MNTPADEILAAIDVGHMSRQQIYASFMNSYNWTPARILSILDDAIPQLLKAGVIVYDERNKIYHRPGKKPKTEAARAVGDADE